MAIMLRIETGEASVDVLPQLGGSVAAFDLKRGAEKLPVFRRWTSESDNPRSFACIAMAPWWARISGGGITLDGVFHPIARNDPEDTHPLHGDGWRSPWEVSEHTGETVVLRLRSRAVPPFDYEARLTYALDAAALTIELAIRNCADRPLPYGMGLHPWFPRTPDATLQARAGGTWLEQPPQLPLTPTPDPLPPEWDFSAPKTLPPDFLDNSFSGWDGRARIEWPDAGYAVTIDTDRSIDKFHVYSLGSDCPFFCFEQVTTVIDAINMPGSPEAKGLRILQPGEETVIRVRYAAEQL